MQQLVECVPNFSEGRNHETIKQIALAIKSVDGVTLADIDGGYAANRTVFTFWGSPKAVAQAAFLSAKTAKNLIDMSKHQGEHPRFGAIDVLPFIPLKNITMGQIIDLARQCAETIGNQLNIPVYCYEYAAYSPKRRNLAACRKGQYEGLAEKMKTACQKPDFGPQSFTESVAKSGACAVGARKFLLAYNINLNTQSAQIAGDIAAEIREKGKIKRDLKGNIVYNQHKKPIYEPGLLKNTKAIGWYIDDFKKAQVSFNIVDIETTPIHVVYETTCSVAQKYGCTVSGSELVGLIPEKTLIEAGIYFLKKNNQNIPDSNSCIIDKAIEMLGLNDVKKFDKNTKILYI